MKTRRILLVEDNRKLLGAMREMLELKGYEALTATGAVVARRILEESRPDLLILDVMLSGESGIDLCREIRRTSVVPILFLTARDGSEDIVTALRAGGDDYMTKPFDFNVLTARIEALLRRAAGTAKNDNTEIRIAAMPLRLDPATRRVSLEGREATLTTTEYAMLDYLSQNADRCVSAEELCNRVWKEKANGDLRMVKQCVWSLRCRIETSGLPLRLEQKRGAGYRLALEQKPVAIRPENAKCDDMQNL